MDLLDNLNLLKISELFNFIPLSVNDFKYVLLFSFISWIILSKIKYYRSLPPGKFFHCNDGITMYSF